MDSLNEFVNVVFGGRITVDQIVTMLVAVFAVVKSFTEWSAKKKLINSTRTLTSVEQELKEEREENKALKDACSNLAEIVVTAYLSSNTISSETKKELVTMANKLKQNANIKISEPVTALITAVENGVNVDLSDVKEELKNKTENLEEILDVANETAQTAIDKLTV
jgi:hypothetical protein